MNTFFLYNDIGDSMKKLNNKGFTLVEVLAVIVIIAIIGGIAVPNIISTINTSKNKSEEILIENIKTASEQLYEEVYYMGGTLYKYDENGDKTSDEITVNDNDNSITINLQTLVSNGFLNSTEENNNQKKIINPKTGENIGSCKIEIVKNNTDGKVTYTISNKSTSNSICPNYGE